MTAGTPNRYQPLPPLADEEYTALKADIGRRGVLVPVVVDQHGAVLDGHHRLRAVEELRGEGVTVADPPVTCVECATDAARHDLAVKLNLLRRQLNPIVWAEVFRDFATRRGVQFGQGRRTSAKLAEVAAEVGVSERTARRRLALAAKVAAYPDLAARVETSGTSGVERMIRDCEKQHQYEKVRVEAMERCEAAPGLILGDFRNPEVGGQIPDESAMLVFTDPPYDRESLHIYGDLAQFAARVLLPGGSLITYAPTYALVEACHLMDQHLRRCPACQELRQKAPLIL